MAKQRGVVQLSGRVDNLCYYQQKKVRGGLVRRVNLAMGERVKTGSEYTRLRLANSYYGACSMCASAIIQMTGSRVDFLHLGDRQAILTKKIYEMQRSYFPEYHEQVVFFPNASSQYLPQCYESIVKNKMSNFFPSVPFLFREVPVGGNLVVSIPSFELENYCRINKCIGVQFSTVSGCYLYGSTHTEDTGKYIYPDNGSSRDRSIYSWITGDEDLDITPSTSIFEDAANFVIIIAIPIVRQVGGRNVTKLTGATARMIGVVFE